MPEYIVNTDNYNSLHGQVTRCRDCRHYVTLDNDVKVCKRVGNFWFKVDSPERFCAWASRKEDA